LFIVFETVVLLLRRPFHGAGNRATGHQAKVNLKSNEKRRLKKEIKEN
jgi:hypothetical protein